jgi:hypothetical protein
LTLKICSGNTHAGDYKKQKVTEGDLETNFFSQSMNTQCTIRRRTPQQERDEENVTKQYSFKNVTFNLLYSRNNHSLLHAATKKDKNKEIVSQRFRSLTELAADG